MSVFSKITNFIRNNKSGASSEALSTRTKKYETAVRIVEEEKLAKQQMPTYEGLERYKLLSKLGDGAFSVVYKALDNKKDVNVAVKVVHKPDLTDQQKASVLKETQIMRTLKHESIVRLLDFIETTEHYFLVLELCEGGELFHQIVRLTYFSEDLARHCVRQVAEGIRYLHEERGIVHRDIKPENLLFDPIPFMSRTTPAPPLIDDDEEKEDEGGFLEGVGGGGIGRVKIADFGLSKVVWEEHTMTPCGTVGYTAPEIVKDERYSKSVDMWALGCVLYTLLCGFPPFFDESIKVLTEKVAKGQFTFLSPWWDPISDEAKDLVANLLCVNVRKRYTIDQFLQHPWMKKGVPPTLLNMRDKVTSTATSTAVTPTETDSAVPTVPTEVMEETSLAESEPREFSDAEKFKRMYQKRESGRWSVSTSGRSTPASERRRDLVSGITSMKEIFDVSYAVHRNVEEHTQQRKQRRKQQKQQQAQGTETVEAIDESDQDVGLDSDLTTDETSTTSSQSNDDELDALCDKLERQAVGESKSGPPPRATVAGKGTSADHRRSKANKMSPVFELTLTNSTLLEKRRNKNEGPQVRTPLVEPS